MISSPLSAITTRSISNCASRHCSAGNNWCHRPARFRIGNLFRATQTEEKLRRDQVQGKTQANKTHFEVGRKVRQTIDELGGTMPENLPKPDTSIQQIESAKKKLEKKKP